MTEEQLWKQLTSKNPHWLTEGVNLTPGGIKKLVSVVFAAGVKEGSTKNTGDDRDKQARMRAAAERLRNQPHTGSNPISDALKDIFGGGLGR